MVIPADVQSIVGQKVFRVSTGETDIFQAADKSNAIIAGLKRRIQQARSTLQSSESSEAARLAMQFRKLHGDAGDKFELEQIITFALKQGGHSLTEYGRRLRASGGVVDEALDEQTRTRVELITGEVTPFLKYIDQWQPHAGLKPRPLDQAISSLRQFNHEVTQPIERLEAKHVQAWIDTMINPHGETGLSAATVARKIGEVRNYWRYLQSTQVVEEGRDPFAGRRIKDPIERRQTSDTKRQKWTPEEVVKVWEAVDPADPLHAVIKIAAYSGARIEGVAQLKVADIRSDRDGVRFMHMADKTAAGDRDVPIHSEIAGLIDNLVQHADGDGFLIRSDAKNKYGERSQPLGKKFGRLKTALGFDDRYVFHGIRKTVASMMQDAGVSENVAADIVGHLKPTMTYGLYGGVTAMGLRKRELERAVRYDQSSSTPSLSM